MTPPLRIDEPLLESAPIAWRMAPQLCGGDAVSGENCLAMHGAWQYLRLLGLVGSIDKRADFYREALASVTATGTAPRVLICGAADYAMLAQVIAAFRGRGIEPDVTVIDLCETPLLLNRWYAERIGCRILTIQCDILAYAAASPYDAVCTDAFFGRFPPGQWPVLLEKWRQVSRPGGHIITATRLRSSGAGEAVGFSAEQARQLRAAVLEQAGRIREEMQIEPAELAARAEAFAARHITHAVTSADDMRALFQRAGFRVDHMASRLLDTESRAGQGPATGNRGDFLNIIAIRA
jgi:SAM-dependent methyltransferase